jgi:hypothetical protein
MHNASRDLNSVNSHNHKTKKVPKKTDHCSFWLNNKIIKHFCNYRMTMTIEQMHRILQFKASGTSVSAMTQGGEQCSNLNTFQYVVMHKLL